MSILDVVTVIGIDQAGLLAALNDTAFDDIEDCLHAVCAADLVLDYIVTRNVKDFAGSAVPSVTPTDFLAKLNK